MSLPSWATTVTPFSKILALILFISFPIFGFVFGMKYQSTVDKSNEELYSNIQSNAIKPTLSNLPAMTPSNLPSVLPSDSIKNSSSSSNISNTSVTIPKGWITYTNVKYGYSISYPPSVIYKYTGANDDPKFVYFPAKDAYYISEQSVQINVGENPNHLSLSDWLKLPTTIHDYMQTYDQIPQEVKIGNITWITSKNGLLSLPPNIEYKWITLYKDKVFLVSNEAIPDEKVFEQILSTFTFTNPK